MHKIEINYDIDRDPDEVFAFLTDFNRIKTWRTLEEMKLEPAGETHVGSILKTKVKGMGKPMQFTNEVIELDPVKRRFQDKAVDGTFLIQSGWKVEPQGEGTKLIWLTEFQASGPMALLTPVLRRAIRSGQLKDLAKLKELLESKKV